MTGELRVGCESSRGNLGATGERGAPLALLGRLALGLGLGDCGAGVSVAHGRAVC
jgi:hypothetical protein